MAEALSRRHSTAADTLSSPRGTQLSGRFLSPLARHHRLMVYTREDIRSAMDAGELDRAARIARCYLHSHREDGRAWELAGLIHFEEGRTPLAISALEKASLLIPLGLESRIRLAIAYGLIGKTDLATDLLALEISHEAISPQQLLAVAQALGRFEQPVLAMHACRTATQQDPEFARAYYDMGFYGSRCGVLPRHVESLIRKSIALDPRSARYRVGLATHLMQHKRIDEACAAIESLTLNQIDTITCQCCLARIATLYERLNDSERLERCRSNLGETSPE